MSLAHLQPAKSDRNRAPSGAAAPRKAGASGTAFCGASHEPVFRTMDDATASGLELCDSCLALFRQQKKAH
jgi:hypothetical protein